MSSILKPPLGMRKHMDTTHSPQSSLVHECQNLTNPPPHGQNWCNKKQQIPHPLGHKKVPKPLVTPINAPYFPGVGGGGGGFNWQVHNGLPTASNCSKGDWRAAGIRFGQANLWSSFNSWIVKCKRDRLAYVQKRSMLITDYHKNLFT